MRGEVVKSGIVRPRWRNGQSEDAAREAVRRKGRRRSVVGRSDQNGAPVGCRSLLASQMEREREACPVPSFPITRQQLPRFPNGAIFVGRRQTLLATQAFLATQAIWATLDEQRPTADNR